MCPLVLPAHPPLTPHALHRILLALIDLVLIQVFVAFESAVAIAVLAEEGLEGARHEVLVEEVRRAVLGGAQGDPEGTLPRVEGAQ